MVGIGIPKSGIVRRTAHGDIRSGHGKGIDASAFIDRNNFCRIGAVLCYSIAIGTAG